MLVYVLTSDARARLDLHRTKEHFHGRKQVGSIGKLNAVGVTVRPTAVLPHQAVPALQATIWDHEPPRASKGRTGLEEIPENGTTENKRAMANPLEEAVNIVNLW